ncbi:hypothetical protein LXL04_034688 [Taraxacum kok-saghyz]
MTFLTSKFVALLWALPTISLGRNDGKNEGGRKQNKRYLNNVKRGTKPISPITITKTAPMFNLPKHQSRHIIGNAGSLDPASLENNLVSSLPSEPKKAVNHG